MNETWRITLRRTAREAVIFMLAGMALSAIAVSSYSYRDQAQRIRIERSALKATCDVKLDMSTSMPIHPVPTPPPGFLAITEWWPLPRLVKCDAAFNDKAIDLAAGLDYIFDKDGHAEYVEARAEGLRIKNLKVDFADCALTGAIAGGFGFVGGLGVWLFYRLVRFAIKG